MNEEMVKNASFTDEVVRLARSGTSGAQLAQQLDDYHEKDIAAALEQLDQQHRLLVYHALGAERLSEVFAYLNDAGKYLRELPVESAASILQEMDADDAVDALETVPPDTRKDLLEQMDSEAKADVRLICSYDEDEIGSQMTTNFILIDRQLTVKQAMRALIAQAEENDNISTIYVSGENGVFCGAIDLKDLIIARENTSLETLISTSYPYVSAHERIEDCIERLKEYAEDSIPVLNEKKRLISIITAQDIVEVVDDEMGDDYAKLGGLTAEEDLNESLLVSVKKRLPWLIILLFLGMVVSTVVGLFEGVVAHVALLVCFQSLILDMAGNVGTQSLAVTIRVLMDESLTARQKLELVWKEMRIGLCNGGLLGVLALLFIGLYVWLFKGKSIHYAFCLSQLCGHCHSHVLQENQGRPCRGFGPAHHHRKRAGGRGHLLQSVLADAGRGIPPDLSLPGRNSSLL